MTQRRRPRPFPDGDMAMVGPGYLQALLAGDHELCASYRIAFGGDELLAAIEAPFGLLMRYLGYHTGKTPTEIGDALVRAARQVKDES